VLYYNKKGEPNMTQEELKRLDKRIKAIQKPFDKGFPTLYRIFQELASAKNATKLNVLQEYMDWKSKNV